VTERSTREPEARFREQDGIGSKQQTEHEALNREYCLLFSSQPIHKSVGPEGELIN
jgi:hypothetical protein